MDTPPSYTAFVGHRRLAQGDALSILRALAALDDEAALVFDDRDGHQTEIDPNAPPAPPRGRGRPKLGVTPREVTLLPRHWDWLAMQPGGASVALRKLIDVARRSDSQSSHAAQEATYRFITAIAGDLVGYEEAIRALFAGDAPAFAVRIAAWPSDIRDYALRLSGAA